MAEKNGRVGTRPAIIEVLVSISLGIALFIIVLVSIVFRSFKRYQALRTRSIRFEPNQMLKKGEEDDRRQAIVSSIRRSERIIENPPQFGRRLPSVLRGGDARRECVEMMKRLRNAINSPLFDEASSFSSSFSSSSPSRNTVEEEEGGANNRRTTRQQQQGSRRGRATRYDSADSSNTNTQKQPLSVGASSRLLRVGRLNASNNSNTRAEEEARGREATEELSVGLLRPRRCVLLPTMRMALAYTKNVMIRLSREHRQCITKSIHVVGGRKGYTHEDYMYGTDESRDDDEEECEFEFEDREEDEGFGGKDNVKGTAVSSPLPPLLSYYHKVWDAREAEDFLHTYEHILYGPPIEAWPEYICHADLMRMRKFFKRLMKVLEKGGKANDGRSRELF